MLTNPTRYRLTIALWIAAFVGLQISYPHEVTGNPMARLGLVYALCEGQLNIDAYRTYTPDWSRTPDGRYYCNKPPGPSLAAFPLYWPFDLWLTRGRSSSIERTTIRIDYADEIQFWISFVIQVLPFAFFLYFAIGRLERLGVSSAAIQLACLCALIGNTASIYMNTMFGHGFTAWVVLALFLSLETGANVWAGIFFGLAMLTDYTMVVLIPAGLWFTRRQLANNPWHVIGNVALGGALPLMTFCLYHAACFGGPFITAGHYWNPMFLEAKAPSSFMGLFYPLPRIQAIKELVFGHHIGIFWTQPWVLLSILFGVVSTVRSRSEFARELAGFGLIGFTLSLLVIGSFGGWYGGYCAGPRYLSPIFPVIALLLGVEYDDMPPFLQGVAITAAWIGAVFSLVAMAVNITPPFGRYALWGYYERKLAKLSWTSLAGLIAWVVILLAISMREPQERSPAAPLLANEPR